MEDLEDTAVGQQFRQVRRLAGARRDLHHVGGAVAGRQLHHAQPIAVGIEPHRLGVDRHGADAIVRQIRQIAAVQANGHDGSPTGDNRDEYGAQERTRTSTALTAST